MLKFPRKKRGKKEKKQTKGEEKGRNEERRGKAERKLERKVKGQYGVVYWERRRKSVKRNEGALLATRKKKFS